MDSIRALVEWIGRHRFLNFIVVIVLVGGIIAVRTVMHASAGKLSEPIQKGSIIDAVYGIGTVTANKRFSVNPLVANTISRAFIKEGDKVKKGKPLFRTDNGNTVYAPFDGVANFVPYRPGENAYPTSPLMVFTDMSDLYIVVSMEQQGALRVKEGQLAKLSFDSMRGKTFQGKVAAVYSYANNFLARIDAVDLPESVLPDMTCDVALVVGVHKDVLLIPIVAFDNGRVWVKRGHGLAKSVPVKLGINDGVWAEVLEGDLQVGDRVMVREQLGQ